MHRNSLVEMSGRSMHQAVRMTLNKINDGPMWQELDFGGMVSEGRKLVERVQAFGFTSTPLGPDQEQQQGQGGGGSAGGQTRAAGGGGGSGGAGGAGGGAGMPKSAEGIAIFIGGQRNHPVVIAVDDRRHRPMGLKPGENAQYDDAQQMTLMRRNGLYLLSNDNADGEGKTAERMVSLRHVEKKKQERKLEQRQNVGGGGQQKQSQQEDFKHEGDTVNTELRVTKKKIEFRNGDEVVGEHDKQTKKWDYKGKEFNVTSEDHANINPGKNVNINPGQTTNVTSPNVNINGASGVAITGPTSVNGNPVATMNIIAALEARIAVLEARLGP